MYLFREDKGADQLRADLRICFRILQKRGFLMTWLILYIQSSFPFTFTCFARTCFFSFSFFPYNTAIFMFRTYKLTLTGRGARWPGGNASETNPEVAGFEPHSGQTVLCP